MDSGSTARSASSGRRPAYSPHSSTHRPWPRGGVFSARSPRPRPLGVYALEWGTANGLAGGVFHGTVMEYRTGRELFVANAYWLPTGGEPLGPMGLEVTCSIDGAATRVRVRQSGTDTGARWKRYQDDMTSGWRVSLDALKQYIEDGAAPRLPGGGPSTR